MPNTAVEIAVRANAAQADRELARLEQRTGRVGRVLSTAVVAGAAAATYGLARFAVASTKAASASEQSLGATETVFRRYADRVIQQSDRAATRVGLSANEYRELANVTGASLAATGMPLSKVTGLTQKLTERAADLAATFGGTTRESIEAVSSLLRGEADPIERYGVSIKQADVNARLAAQGLDQLEGSAKKQAEMQARLDLLFQQTARSAGAFGRESNTLAGQQQRLNAQSENLQATVGTALTPALTALARTAASDVLPPVQDLAERYAPALGRSLEDLATAAGPRLQSTLRALPGFFDDLRSGDAGGDLDSIATSFSRMGPLADRLGDTLPSVADALSVTAEVTKFAADNTDLLADALPFLAAGYVALKVGQLASNVALAASLPLKVAEVAVNRQLVASNKALIATRAADAAAVRTASSAQVASNVATTRSVSRLGIAARGAAGVAGLGAVTAAAGTTDRSMGILLSTLGGAATGFALGGPIGALIGGAGGGLVGLATSAGQAEEGIDGVSAAASRSSGPMSQARTVAGDYASSLNQITGAATASTRATALKAAQDAEILTLTSRVGINTRDLVGAMLGQAGATRRVNAALRENAGALDGVQQVDLRDFLANNTAAFREQAGQVRQNFRDTQTWGQALKGLPPRVQTIVKDIGTDISVQRLNQLRRRYDLTPKQVRTIVQAIGTETTIRKVGGVYQVLRDGARVKPDLSTWAGALSAGLTDGRRRASRGSDDVRRELAASGRVPGNVLAPWLSSVTSGIGRGRTAAQRGGRDFAGLLTAGTRGARADLGPFQGSLAGGIASARSTASSGGASIGSALAAGMQSGLFGGLFSVVAAARSTVAQAIAAAKNEAQQRSPSRKTRRIGEGMGDGFVVGMRARRAAVALEGRRLSLAVVKAASGGSGDVTAAIRRELEQRGVKGRAMRVAVRATRDETRALVANAKAQQRVNQRLADARRRYADLVQESRAYSAQIRDAVVASGNVTGFVDSETGSVTSRDLIDGLRDRVAAAERYASLLRSLRGRLNDTALQQLIDAGVDGGLATAEALTAGGDAAVREVNRLTGRLQATGTTLGNTMATEFHGAGVRAAAGLVRGLEGQQRQLDRAAARMGRRLVREVRRALRTGSPSREFRDIGLDVVKGLDLGLDETYVRRAGRVTADALVEGFARPQLEAAAVARVSGGVAGGAVLRAEVRLTAEQLTAVQRGKAIQLDLEAYDRAGGRAKVR